MTEPTNDTRGSIDQAAVMVLTAHQRLDAGSCLCGWGVDNGAGNLGHSHALHVWRKLQAADVDNAREQARAERAEAELDRLHSWGGLLELLDEHWPTDIFPMPPGWDDAKSTTRRDTGPVILGLIRWVDKLSAEGKAEALEAQVRERIAQEIEADAESGNYPRILSCGDGLRRAARIARTEP